MSDLTLSKGALTLSFSSGANIYADSVSNSIVSITVTATTGDNTATATVNGMTVVSGMVSGAT